MSAVPPLMSHPELATTVVPQVTAGDLRTAVMILLSLATYSAAIAVMSVYYRSRGSHWLLTRHSLRAILEFRSPAAGLTVGLLLAAYGLYRCGSVGFFGPAFGLFVAIVGGIVALESAKLASRNWDMASVDHGDAPDVYQGNNEAIMLGNLSGRGFDAYDLRMRLDRNNDQQYHETPLVEATLRSGFVTAEDLMLLLIDLIDAEDWHNALAVAYAVADWRLSSAPAFFILKAAAEAGVGKARDADLSIRQAYRVATDPPEWLTHLLVEGPNHGGPAQWYSREVRGYILQSVLVHHERD